MALGGARRELAAQTDNRAKHAARSEKYSADGRLVLHVTARARAARHGTTTRRQRRCQAAAANRARCLRKGASANGVGEPTWRGPVAGGVVVYTHVGRYGFESCCARAFLLLLAFGALGRKSQRTQKRPVVRGRTGRSCVFGGWPRVAYFPRFFPMRVLRFTPASLRQLVPSRSFWNQFSNDGRPPRTRRRRLTKRGYFG